MIKLNIIDISFLLHHHYVEQKLILYNLSFFVYCVFLFRKMNQSYTGISNIHQLPSSIFVTLNKCSKRENSGCRFESARTNESTQYAF
jgi:hypothetical protein